jgi:hypothetical protein
MVLAELNQLLFLSHILRKSTSFHLGLRLSTFKLQQHTTPQNLYPPTRLHGVLYCTICDIRYVQYHCHWSVCLCPSVCQFNDHAASDIPGFYIFGRKSVLVPLCSPQIPHTLASCLQQVGTDLPGRQSAASLN